MDVNVPGFGVMRFPDDMSRDDIAAAIDARVAGQANQPKSFLSRFEDPFNLGKPSDYLPKVVTDYLGPPEESPSPPTMAREIAKGVPIAGRYVPQTEEMTQMEQQWPKTSMAANISGGVLSMAPIAELAPLVNLRNATMIGTPGRLATPMRSGFKTNLAVQGGLNSAIGAGDVAAEKGFENISKEDVTRAILLGFGTAGVGAGLQKAITPSAPVAGARMWTPEQAALLEAIGGVKGTALPIKSAPGVAAQIPGWLETAASPGPMSALGGYMGGMQGAELGGFAGFTAQKGLETFAKTPMGKKWLENQAMNQTRNQQMLNAVLYGTTSNLARPGIAVSDDSAN